MSGSEMREAPTVHELHRDFDADLLTRFYREILEPAFSSDELVEQDSLASALLADQGPGSWAAVALAPDGQIMGGLIGDHDPDSRVLLLSYLAVREDRRDQGIGGFMLRQVAPGWYQDDEVLLAVGEVHDPRVWSEREGDASAGRLRLYERLGAQVLDMPFVQPALKPGSNRVPGFLLLAFHVDPSVRAKGDLGEGVPARLISKFVRRYYEGAEGVKEPYDPELTALLGRIDQDELVRLLPVSDYDQVRPLELS